MVVNAGRLSRLTLRHDVVFDILRQLAIQGIFADILLLVIWKHLQQMHIISTSGALLSNLSFVLAQ